MTERTEITLEELADLPEGTRLLIDTRDEISMFYGTIPGAKHIPDLLEQAERGTLPKDRSLFSGPNAKTGIYVGLGGDRFMDESGATCRRIKSWCFSACTAPRALPWQRTCRTWDTRPSA